MGKVLSINVSTVRGVDKKSVGEVNVLVGWGLEGDAHGGNWDRQVSILPVESLEKVPKHKIDEVLKGGYTENFTVSGIPPAEMTIGKTVRLGEAEIMIEHIGKEHFKDHGRPYIVSREGRFGKVVKGGRVKVGDNVEMI